MTKYSEPLTAARFIYLSEQVSELGFELTTTPKSFVISKDQQDMVFCETLDGVDVFLQLTRARK